MWIRWTLIAPLVSECILFVLFFVEALSWFLMNEPFSCTDTCQRFKFNCWMLMMCVLSQVKFDSVGGLNSHIHALKEMVVFPLLYPEIFEKFRIQPPRWDNRTSCFITSFSLELWHFVWIQATVFCFSSWFTLSFSIFVIKFLLYFRGCLFYGPPGTGKTLVARALANECSYGDRKVSFFMRKGADCLSKWVGESERQLRLLFDQVRY